MTAMRFLAVSALGFALTAGPATATEQTLIRLNTFPNARALPFYVGVEKGMFGKHGLKLELSFTDNSRTLREGLASGKFDIVHSAVDNAVAMVEVAKVDVVIVTGGDSGTNEFIVQPDIKSWEDIRGKALVVDATNTAYALVGKKILLKQGLKDGADYKLNPAGNGTYRFKAMTESKDNAAAVMNLPYSVQAIELGMKSLGRTTDMLGPYQAGGAFVLRSWAQANGPTLERYIAAYVEALRWVTDKRNRAEAVTILTEKMKLPRALAERSYDLMIEPGFGFTPDAKFNVEGFKNVLALRAEVEGGSPQAPERYVDLSYYDRAIKRLASR